jgi:PTS system mannose-specific IIA component
VVVTDLFGGSPSNLSMAACAPRDRVIFYGANLPALIKLARSRQLPVADAVAAARAAGIRYMDMADGPGDADGREAAAPVVKGARAAGGGT